MADILTITPRLLYEEDCQLSTENSPTPVTEYVEGVGNVALTPLTPILINGLTPAADDTAAGVAGVHVGYLYFNTGTNLPKVRMS